jgi:hypothetical protein
MLIKGSLRSISYLPIICLNHVNDSYQRVCVGD